MQTTQAATFLGADQDWNTETTIYWFESFPTRHRPPYKFGIAESGGESTMVDADGRLVTEPDLDLRLDLLLHLVTDEMREEAAEIWDDLRKLEQTIVTDEMREEAAGLS